MDAKNEDYTSDYIQWVIYSQGRRASPHGKSHNVSRVLARAGEFSGSIIVCSELYRDYCIPVDRRKRRQGAILYISYTFFWGPRRCSGFANSCIFCLI